MKKLLIISTIPTHPTDQGNRKCILTYSEMLLGLGYDIRFLLIVDNYTSQEEIYLNTNYWGNKLILYKRKKIDKIWIIWANKIYFKLFKNMPLDYLYPSGFTHFLKTLQKKEKFDIVLSNYILLSKSFSAFSLGVKKLLYTHDSFSERYSKTGNKGYSVTKIAESRALNRADVILSIQDEERIFFNTLTNKKVITCFTYFPLTISNNLENKVLLFIASDNIHNQKGIRDFVTEYFPSIKSKVIDIKLLIGGSICSKIQDLNEIDGIELFGYVDDLLEFYDKGTIVVNPVSCGTGFKIKSFEALSFGKILISNPHNTIGIFDKVNSPIIEADTPNEFADKIAALFEKNTLEVYKKASIDYVNRFNINVKNKFIEAIEEDIIR